MRAQTLSSNLFKSLGTAMVVGTIAITAQMVNGQPQPLSLDQLQAVTGGGDCEGCKSNETVCRNANDETCTPASTAGKFQKIVYTGQDAQVEVTDKDSGIEDAVANTPEDCNEKWTGCDKVNGSCVNCETTSTSSTVNSNCHANDPTACPAS
ncbi:hypothetical protein [Gimesia aquarii]|uniref:Uncharacterized protein n=1 Tax=Gimesia aquarii TaxID=2527964 RepID=A0A517WTZ9_9PLAN|nr:hypothetical protein [Gimesia aquarii]QDU08739.1 hypothetical protein V202x_21090 [Gimesia aquarii]